MHVLRILPQALSEPPMLLRMTLLEMDSSAVTDKPRQSRQRASGKPPVKISVDKKECFVSSTTTLGQLLDQATRDFGIDVQNICMHILTFKSRAGLKANTLFTPSSLKRSTAAQEKSLHKTLMALEIEAESEILVEHAESRGMFTSSLADAEVERRKKQRAITVEETITAQENTTSEAATAKSPLKVVPGPAPSPSHESNVLNGWTERRSRWTEISL